MIREAQRQGLDREASIRDLSDGELDGWIKERMYDPTRENDREETEGSISLRSRRTPGGRSNL